MEHAFSRRTANIITAVVLAIIVVTFALDCAGGFTYDHWRDSVMATFQ